MKGNLLFSCDNSPLQEDKNQYKDSGYKQKQQARMVNSDITVVNDWEQNGEK